MNRRRHAAALLPAILLPAILVTVVRIASQDRDEFDLVLAGGIGVNSEPKRTDWNM